MSNTKQNFNQLDATLAVKELDNEAAAAIQGGDALELYGDSFLRSDSYLGGFNFGGKTKLSSKANDKISSIKINEGLWRFYEHENYGGASIELKPGTYNDLHYFNLRYSPFTTWNDQISSFKRV